jgi:S1-C subfamily serine protease
MRRITREIYQSFSPGVVNINFDGHRPGLVQRPTLSRELVPAPVLDKEGHILTNYHVIQEAEKLSDALQ